MWRLSLILSLFIVKSSSAHSYVPALTFLHRCLHYLLRDMSVRHPVSVREIYRQSMHSSLVAVRILNLVLTHVCLLSCLGDSWSIALTYGPSVDVKALQDVSAGYRIHLSDRHQPWLHQHHCCCGSASEMVQEADESCSRRR